MKILKFNISKPKQYTKNGVEKTLWQNIGTITRFEKDDGSLSEIIEIPAISLQANIFPFEDKKEYGQRTQPVKKEITPEEEYNQITPTKEVDEEIDADSIPY